MIVFYFLNFLFALLHISNFKFSILALIIVFFSYIPGTFLFSYARLRLGFIWAVLLHIIGNFQLKYYDILINHIFN